MDLVFGGHCLDNSTMDSSDDRCFLDSKYFRSTSSLRKRQLSDEHLAFLNIPPGRSVFVCNGCYMRVHRQYKSSPLAKAYQQQELLEDQLHATEDKLTATEYELTATEEILVATKKTLVQVRKRKKNQKKTSKNRKDKIRELKAELKTLMQKEHALVKNTRSTAGKRGMLSSSYILGVDQLLIRTNLRPNKIQEALEVILAEEHFIEDPPSKEDLKIAKKDSHYNIEILCDVIRYLVEKERIKEYKGWIKIHWDFSTDRCKKMLPILLDLEGWSKAYLLPIINTPDKSGLSVSTAINTCVCIKKKNVW